MRTIAAPPNPNSSYVLVRKNGMSAIYVKNGTPAESQSKCASCLHAHILRGFRESEEITYCTFSYDRPLQVPFKVHDCTMYTDRTRPTWKQMEDLAIDILPLSSGSGKPAGFAAREVSTEPEKESEETQPETVNR